MSLLKRKRAIALIAASSAMVSLPIPARTQELTTVRVGGSGNDDMVPVLYAIRSGLFKKAGLDVQMQSADAGLLTTALANGTLNIAKQSLLALITAYDHGAKFKILVGAAIYSSTAATTQIAVLKNSDIKSTADLSGKVGGIPVLRGLNELGTLALIDRTGGNPATVKFVEIPYTTMLPALERGTIDFAEIAPPFLAPALESGKIRTIEDPFAGLGNPAPISAWFTTQEYAARNPTVVRRFAEVVRTATAYTLSHLPETVPLLAEYSRIDPEVLRKMQRTPISSSLNVPQLQREIDLAAKFKYISQTFSAKELVL